MLRTLKVSDSEPNRPCIYLTSPLMPLLHVPMLPAYIVKCATSVHHVAFKGRASNDKVMLLIPNFQIPLKIYPM